MRAIDAYWITAAEHGMNASTFTARVVASTGADVAAALSAAVGAPLCRNVQVCPPSVDLYSPQAAAPGISDTVPPVTDDTPRTARVVAA